MSYKISESYFPALYHSLVIFLLVANALFLGQNP